jgi:hypothetical protein
MPGDIVADLRAAALGQSLAGLQEGAVLGVHNKCDDVPVAEQPKQ